MQKCTTTAIAITGLLFVITGCTEDDFQTNVEAASVGAQTYTPSVYIEPGNEARYRKVLATCRDVASNRQLTAAQTAELRATTGMTDAAMQGALEGIAETAFSDGDIGDAMGSGLLLGMLGSAVSESSRGTAATAAATREALLNCLRATGRGGALWTVVE